MQIAAAQEKESPHLSAAMQAGAESLEAILFIRGTAAADDAAAAAHIVAVDAPSEGVPMRQLRMAHLDVSAAGLAVYFSGCSKVCVPHIIYPIKLTS